MSKSIPFVIQFSLPRDVIEGGMLEIDGVKSRITKIKSIIFLDMRTIQVVGLCKPIRP